MPGTKEVNGQDTYTRVHEKATTHGRILLELTKNAVYGSRMWICEECLRVNPNQAGGEIQGMGRTACQGRTDTGSRSRECRRIRCGPRFNQRGTRQDPQEKGAEECQRTQRKRIVDCGAYEFQVVQQLRVLANGKPGPNLICPMVGKCVKEPPRRREAVN